MPRLSEPVRRRRDRNRKRGAWGGRGALISAKYNELFLEKISIGIVGGEDAEMFQGVSGGEMPEKARARS